MAKALREIADIGRFAILIPMPVLVTVGPVDGMRAGGGDISRGAATFEGLLATHGHGSSSFLVVWHIDYRPYE
ncbi:MAG: hypothetical protein ABI955_03665 [Nitrospirota bacterium]